MKKIKIINEELFKIGKYEFIKFKGDDGNIIGVLKDSLCWMWFGLTADFSKSDIFKKLNEEFLPEIESIVGAENVLEFETNLEALDGSEKFGVMRSKISLPTEKFLQKNRAMFAKYRLKDRWWLATPFDTEKFMSDWWIRYASPCGKERGFVYSTDDDLGVRPIMSFSSSIFDSLET